MKILVFTFALITVLFFLRLLGIFLWKVETKAIRTNLKAQIRSSAIKNVDFTEITSLPAPVQHYFHTVLEQGMPIVRSARIWQSGSFNQNLEKDHWKSFSADQKVITQPPGFDWDARVSMMPGVPCFVHDSYVAGEGFLHASVSGLISVAKLRGGSGLAEGELMRYLAETAWYPTALLPGQGVEWQSIDQNSARALLRDADVIVSLVFRFNQDGLIEEVFSEGRGRSVAKEIVITPWQGRFWNYQKRANMLVPLNGEVAWQIENELKTYWRGHIEKIHYRFNS